MSEQAWRRDVLAARLPRLALRRSLHRRIETWFEAEGFLLVETPALVPSPGLEPHLAVFRTTLSGVDRKPVGERFLHTSPEFAMKMLLAGGCAKIAQLARVWRNAEGSRLHAPEFTMLEWYRADAPWTQLIEDTLALVRLATAAAAEAGLGDGQLVWGERRCDPMRPPLVLTVREAVIGATGIDLAAHPAPGDLAARMRAAGFYTAPDDRWDDLVLRILGERVEPELGTGRPAFLTAYPAAMAALARLEPEGDPAFPTAERVEAYICGVELANGFGELTDAAEQARRFAEDQALRRQLYGEEVPVDPVFLAALAEMPEAAGMALGFDRLVMLASQARHIDDVLWLPVR